MNFHAYFKIIFYILILPISFRMLMALRLEDLFKRGTPRQVIVAFYFLMSVAVSQLFISYFIQVFTLVSQIFQ